MVNLIYLHDFICGYSLTLGFYIWIFMCAVQHGQIQVVEGRRVQKLKSIYSLARY